MEYTIKLTETEVLALDALLTPFRRIDTSTNNITAAMRRAAADVFEEQRRIDAEEDGEPYTRRGLIIQSYQDLAALMHKLDEPAQAVRDNRRARSAYANRHQY